MVIQFLPCFLSLWFWNYLIAVKKTLDILFLLLVQVGAAGGGTTERFRMGGWCGKVCWYLSEKVKASFQMHIILYIHQPVCAPSFPITFTALYVVQYSQVKYRVFFLTWITSVSVLLQRYSTYNVFSEEANLSSSTDCYSAGWSYPFHVHGTSIRVGHTLTRLH